MFEQLVSISSKTYENIRLYLQYLQIHLTSVLYDLFITKSCEENNFMSLLQNIFNHSAS